MTELEHLLTCLSEECAEVQQCVAKIQRFGLYDSYKDRGVNQTRLQEEVCDLIGALAVLQDRGVLHIPDLQDVRVQDKKAKIMKYLAYARERGCVVEDS